MVTSTLVAFLVTPWLASRLLKPDSVANHQASLSAGGPPSYYARLLDPIIGNRRRAKGVLWIVLGLFVAAAPVNARP